MHRTFTIIQTLKQLPYGVFCIESAYQNQPFLLLLLTRETIGNRIIIRTLATWRKQHEMWFPAQFPVTFKRTKIWLKEKVIDKPDRLLFMVHINGEDIGHVGLFRFKIKHAECEIDNIVRGKIGFPGIMTQAIVLMMKWGKETFRIKRYRLQTTSDNKRALQLYERLGFEETKRIPLVYYKTNDGGQWREVMKNDKAPFFRYQVFMSLNYVETK